MASQISCTSAQKNAFNVVESLIRIVPEKSAIGTTTGDSKHQQTAATLANPSDVVPHVADNKRIRKFKQQIAKQNIFITELKQKIRLLSEQSPKSIADQEELTFLRSRLDKENQLLKSLVERLVKEQKSVDSPGWEQIRLCIDPLDDVCRNPWMLGNVPMQDQRFSFDSTLSSIVSLDQIDEESVHARDGRARKELINRDRVIEIQQARVEALSADVLKLKKDHSVIMDKNPRVTQFCKADIQNRLRFYMENAEALEKNLNLIGTAMNAIRAELHPVGGCQESVDCTTFNASNDRTIKTSRESLSSKQEDDQYNSLLKEYAKKDEQCKRLTDRLARACSCKNDVQEQLELDVLKKRCSELLDTHDEFRILIKEQGDQLEEYRSKYLSAQQKVEEQKLQMNTMNITNRRIEEQINIEVQRIKTKFQDKLKQLTPFPRLLKEEEQKVSNLKKSNEILLEELKTSVREIKTLEHRLNITHTTQNTELEKTYKLLQVELEQLQSSFNAERENTSKLQAKLEDAQKEAEDTRAETAKIIARTNERSQEEQKSAQAKIHALELELAQCRASASVTINNREEAMREMQGQIGVLSASLNDAQIQIQSLRNQLTFLQNERYLSLA